ncbi:MAG: hypothetical protein AMJ94_00170 [Deltaproteobacteria bacterium SM23_61]|nr:MAG: hypothetical protein AMJ94_00170 [Deltaproteobacteria bacterium SM23_61]
MFDYPLSKPRRTLYHKLGISPEATQADILEAKMEQVNSLMDQKKELEKKLRAVYDRIPELEAAAKSVTEQQRQQAENPAKLKQALLKLTALENEAVKCEPKYREFRKQIEDITKKINEINNMRIESPDERKKYDLETPPCALLKLFVPSFPLFAERHVVQHFVRLEVAAFLEKEKKLAAYHPSDFTRKNFESDFSPNDYLDGE